MKRSFVLLVAIFFVILISTLGALSLALAASSVKNTSGAYLREQAELLAISATEHAVLALQAHDFNGTNPCLESINSQFPNENEAMFDINVTIAYIANDLDCNKISIYNGNKIKNVRINIEKEEKDKNSTTILQRDRYKMAIIDTIVTSTPDVISEPIRFHRRTTQPLNYTTKNFKDL